MIKRKKAEAIKTGGMNMSRKIKKFISQVVCILGFILLLCTAGASDLDLIPFSDIVIRAVSGLVMFGGGAYCGGLIR